MPASIVVVAIILAVIVAMAILAPWLAPFDPDRQDLLSRLRPPGFVRGGMTYWFGTDNLGRDLLSRVIYGARASLAVASLSVAVSTLVGVSLGMVAGWFRGWAEILIMRLVDIMMSIPAILLAVLTVAVLGPGFAKLVLVLGLTRWPRYTRVAYGQTLQLAQPALHQGVGTRRRGRAAHPLPSRAAEHRRAGADRRHHRVRPDDPDGGRPFLPRARHPAARRRAGARS